MIDQLRQAAQQALEALEAVGAEFICDATHHHKKEQHGGLDDCPNQARHDRAITAIREALAQPVQKPATCRFCHSKKGCWTWQCYHCGEIDDVQKPIPPATQPVQEPLEYWNAVEGWVKIDEVREHFDSVGCGTIYKTAGEDRVPLYTAPPQRPWVGLTEFQFAEIYNKWNDTNNSTPWGLNQALEAKLKELNK